jgi:subtilisin-like proprotein convertase family protein
MRRTKTLIGSAAAIALAVAGAAQADVFNYSNVGNNLAIPDGAGDATGGNPVSLSIITNNAGYAIKSLRVGINVTHTWQGDVRIWLEAPNGQTVHLINRPGRLVGVSTFGYSNDNFGNLGTNTPMWFDDLAAGTYNSPNRGGIGPATTGTLNVVGDWRADNTPFEGFGNGLTLGGAFAGLELVGEWKLWARDFAGGDTGALRNFYLVFDANLIPAPGALALLGLAGLAGASRRRRS